MEMTGLGTCVKAAKMQAVVALGFVGSVDTGETYFGQPRSVLERLLLVKTQD